MAFAIGSIPRHGASAGVAERPPVLTEDHRVRAFWVGKREQLQGYVDRFLFQKALSYAKEALDRPGAELSAILRTKAVILCREVFEKAMPFDLKEAYGKWRCGIFADDGHQ